MMPFVLNDIFTSVGKHIEDYLTLKEVDPMYRLQFDGLPDFYPTRDSKKMIDEIERVFPGNSKGYTQFMSDHRKTFPRILDLLKQPYTHWYQVLRPSLIRSLPSLNLGRSVYGVMQKYFSAEELRISMTFQAKYLGMSPWNCPGTFSILPYIEHEWGVWHPIGGLNQISQALAKAATEEGATISCNTKVQKLITHNGTAKGVVLGDGTEVQADIVIINADFADAMETLVDEDARPHWSNARLNKAEYSCSTFMLYLGLDTQYDLPHHSIHFAKDYKANVEDCVTRKVLSDDFSFYVQSPSTLDPTLAPAGHSTMYILVPVPNLDSTTDWKAVQSHYTEKVLQQLETRLKLHDIRAHITEQKCITPLDWKHDYSVFKGAVFNLGHTLKQMLTFRPRNKFTDIAHCYLVGGGTHPGSGLPTILESGTITTNLILQYEKN
jgi:phytoene desaturase